MSKENGGQAFPALHYQAIENGEEVGDYAQDGGMTLRDWFAGQAICGMISSLKSGDNARVFPQIAYEVADDMIKERSKE